MSIMNLFLVLIMVVYIHKGILGLVYARVIALAVALVYQTFVLPMRHRCVFDTALLREMFKFGFPLGLNNILYFVFTKFDALLLGAMLSPVGVAYYGTATRIPDASRRMFESFRTVYFPNMAELFVARKKQEAEALLNNSLRIVSFLTIFITLVSVLFRERIVVFLFTAQYLDCAPVLAVLMVALSIGLVGNILGTSLVSAGYPKLPVVINIADTSVNVLANLMLIPVMGVMGAACAALLARAVTNPLNVWFLKKSGINVMISEYLKPFAIFAVCLMIQLVVGSHNILFYLCIIGLYVVLSQLFSVVSLNEVRFILRELRLYPTDVAAAGD